MTAQEEQIVSEIMEAPPYEDWGKFLNDHFMTDQDRIIPYIDCPPDVDKKSYLNNSYNLHDIFGSMAESDGLNWYTQYGPAQG